MNKLQGSFLLISSITLTGCASVDCLTPPFTSDVQSGLGGDTFCVDSTGKKECTAPFDVQKSDSLGGFCADKDGNKRQCLVAPFTKLTYKAGKAICEDDKGHMQCDKEPNTVQKFGKSGGYCENKNYTPPSGYVPPAPPVPTSASLPAMTIGVSGGMTNAGSTASLAPNGGYPAEAATTFPMGGGNFDCNSGTYGAQVGLQVPFANSMYLGGELAATKVNNNCSRDGMTPRLDPMEAGVSQQAVKIKETGTASALLGYNLNDDFSVYGKAGWAVGNADITSNLSIAADDGGIVFNNATNSDHLNGYLLGVGANYNVTSNFSLGLVYDHISFGNSSINAIATVDGVAVAAGTTSTASTDLNSVSVKANVKLGG